MSLRRLSSCALFALLAVLCVVSCQKDAISGAGNLIRFKVNGFRSFSAETKSETGTTRIIESSDADDSGLCLQESISEISIPLTKGAVATTANFADLYGEFTLDAFIKGYKEKYIDGLKINNEEGNWVIPTDEDGNPFTWFYNTDIEFWAYAPSLSDIDGAFEITSYSTGAITFRYGYFDEALERPYTKDLVFAHAEQREGSVGLEFEHALAAVTVTTGELPEGYTLAGCDLLGLHTIGECTYSPDAEEGHFSWTGKSTELGSYISKCGEGQDKLNAGNFHFIIPQELGSEAVLRVIFEKEDGNEVVKTFSLENTKWDAGKKYVYKIGYDPSSYVFEATELNAFTQNGGSATSVITSSKTKASSGTVKMDFSLVGYSLDNGETWTEQKPDFITIGQSVNGSLSTNIRVTTGASPIARIEQKMNDELAAAAPVSGIYDLSTSGGATKCNTANCYIVSAPGTYSLPLVYGCAIVNDEIYEGSYKVTPSLTLKDHLLQEIDSPHIYDRYTPANCCLVWEDEENLVTDVRLSDDGKSLVFNVPSENIKQGNALVAVRDENDVIMWNWHIWVTIFDYNEHAREIENLTGKTHIAIGRILGQCDASIKYYDERKVLIKYVQDESGKEVILTMNQAGAEVRDNSNVTYFLGGRNTPYIGSSYSNPSKDKTYYPGEDRYALQKIRVTSRPSESELIQNPHIIYFGFRHSNINSFWGISVNEDRMKTIYDPCPVGFVVPDMNTFTAFTYDGESIYDYSYNHMDRNLVNTPYPITSMIGSTRQWTGYCKKMKGYGEWDTSGGTYTVFACGYRDWNNDNISFVGNILHTWISEDVYARIGDYVATPTMGQYTDKCGIYPVVDVFHTVEPASGN